MHVLPTQDQFLDLEEINPAEAYRKQAEAINEAGPLYAELESLENRHHRVQSTLKDLRSEVLSQNMPVPSSSTRTTDLVDAFILSCSKNYKSPTGETKDISHSLRKMERVKSKLESRISQISRRLRAIEDMAEKCDRIMNWAKHEARLEYKS